MTRIKTLAQIGDQYDRITGYLESHGRTRTTAKIDGVYERMFERILKSLGVERLDDETVEWLLNEPLIVGATY